MSLVLVVIVSLIPGLLWVWFFYVQDRLEKEPLRLIWRSFIAGAVAVGFAAVFELPFRHLLNQEHTWVIMALISFFVIGLGEEFFKASATYFTIYKNQEFNEPMDGIVYSVTTGIGFSVVENILYALTFGLSVVPIRAIIATLAHACFSGIFGVFISRAKTSSQPKKMLFKGLGYSALIHGLYDFVLIIQIFSPWFALLIVLLAYLVLRHYILQALSHSPFGN